MSRLRTSAALLAAFAIAGFLAGCRSDPTATAGQGQVLAVGAENQYANVISQVGGKYVAVSAIVSNPNIDPHTYEASPSVAQVVGAAKLVVQNGLGYDTYMNRIEDAPPNATRRVIDVQKLLGLPDSTPNPHLWYQPRDDAGGGRRRVARRARDAATRPRRLLHGQRDRFDASLEPWYQALRRSRSATRARRSRPPSRSATTCSGGRGGQPDAVRLPGRRHERRRPGAAGRDARERAVLQHKVKVFLYNQQVTDSLTQSLLAAAHQDGIPVVGVYETMPTPATTTSRGCWPRSRRFNGRWRTESRPRGCNDAKRVRATATPAGRARRRGRHGAAGRPHRARRRQLHDPRGRVHRPDRRQRRREDDPVPGDPRPPVAGQRRCVRVRARPRRAGRRSGTCPQKFLLDPGHAAARPRPRRRSGSTASGSASHCPREPAASRVEEMLDAVDARGFADARVGQLSGGEQQRILIAHALIAGQAAAARRAARQPRPAQRPGGRHAAGRIARRAADRDPDLRARHEPAAAGDRPDRVPGGRARRERNDRGGRPHRRVSKLYGHHVDVLRVHGRVLVVAGQRADEPARAPARPTRRRDRLSGGRDSQRSSSPASSRSSSVQLPRSRSALWWRSSPRPSACSPWYAVRRSRARRSAISERRADRARIWSASARCGGSSR